MKLAGLITITLLVGGCASLGGQRNTASDNQASTASSGNELRQSSSTNAQDTNVQDIDADLMFHVLAAERLSADGNFFDAYGHAYEAALLSDNSDLARQAASLAMRVGDWSGVTQSARRWRQLDADSNAAQQLIILGLINQGQSFAAAREIEPRFDPENSGSTESRSTLWRDSVMLIASAEDDADALATMDALITRVAEADDSQVLEARSLLLWQLGQPEAAFDLAREAAEGSENVERLIWAAQLAAANDAYATALELYQEASEIDSDNVQLALAQAEVLRQMERDDEAVALLQRAPASTGTLYTLGVYQFESDQLDDAARTWQRLANLESPEDSTEHAFLTGFLAELLELDEQALAWFEQVEDGPNVNRALLRRAGIQGRSGELMQARNLLRAVRLGDDAELVEQSWLSEAELLRNADRADECIEVLTGVLRENPSSIWLLYSRALCAVDADRLELAEQDLRGIIRIDGDNAMALNALGYTLTDRTRRHSEAMRLIERALELQPDDPATLDSMGWVLYRLGRLEESLDYLQRAYEADSNPEIAAHLAEVLYYSGQREDALALLQTLLKAHPEETIVIETKQRLTRGSE